MSDTILFTEEQIQNRIEGLATEIAKDYMGKEAVLVCVLSGAFMFVTDLSKALWRLGLTDFEIDFVKISSYGESQKSSGNPTLGKDIETDIANKQVLIIEDIIETGYTIKFLIDHLSEKKPSGIKVCSLLSKPLREVEIEPDYVGFTVQPTDWVEGYGLDSDSKGRGRGEIVKIVG